MAYRRITDAVVAPGKRATAATPRQLRDNLEAVLVGARSSPKIKPYAIETFTHDFPVPFSMSGTYNTSRPVQYKRSLGEGNYENVSSSITTANPPIKVVDAIALNFITDPLLARLDYVDWLSVEATGDSSSMSPALTFIVRDETHAGNRAAQRVSLTVELTNDPRAANSNVVITGRVNCRAYYFRDHSWIPDADRQP